MDEILKYFPKLSSDQVRLLTSYQDQLLSWNTKINLISRQDTQDVIVHHILHSLAIAKCFDFPRGTRILDLGTGGGLPGIPLAIVFPHCRFTLIDSRGKKVMAVQSMIDFLGLMNAIAAHTRAEDYHGEFDYVVTRAVAELSELWRWSLKFFGGKTNAGNHKALTPMQYPIGTGGKEWTRGLIALKGGDLSGELHKTTTQELKVSGISLNTIFTEPYFDGKHLLFIGMTARQAKSETRAANSE